MAEYVTCPACGSKVLTADTELGRHVRCFGCDFRFLATPDPPAPDPPPRPPPASRSKSPPAPPRFSEGEEDEDDQPFCPGCGRQVSWEVTACPHCGEEFEEEEAPPRLARPFRLDIALPLRRDGEPHRGNLLYWLGIASAITGGLSACTWGLLAIISIPLGLTVWVLARRDLRRMVDGSVDPQGLNYTRNARSAAIAGIAFGVLFAGIYLLFLR
jgi:DNA-directed RNA polymerase subunit RPC12/RpoP